MKGGLSVITKGDIDLRFNYHKPDEEKALTHQAIRDDYKALAELVVDQTPEGREQSLALTHLEESMFWANAAVARLGN